VYRRTILRAREHESVAGPDADRVRWVPARRTEVTDWGARARRNNLLAAPEVVLAEPAFARGFGSTATSASLFPRASASPAATLVRARAHQDIERLGELLESPDILETPTLTTAGA